jgi:maltooligosyltrehalose trehalohydrolase
MRRRHDMPFGAAIGDDGATRFRLWAPAARRVDLVATAGSTRLDFPLQSEAAGWWSAQVASAAAGTRYGFRIDGGIVVPDPASRSNPEGVHAPSAVVDPLEFDWGEETSA